MSREVPDGWRGIKLGELTHIIGGTTPSKAEPNYWDGGDICWATPTDITSLGIGQYELKNTKSYVTKLGVSKSSLQIIPVGSVLMTSRATIGYAAINSVPMTTNQGFSVFFPNDQFDSRFLLQWIIWKRAELHNIAGGSTFLEISKTTLRTLEIELPPFHDQRRIAEILSSVDDAIAATQGVIEQTKKVKQATLERLLTKGIGHTRFKQTEIGEIPDSWIISTADEICSQISVGIVIKPSRYYTDNGVRCFRSANVREGFIEDADWVFITEEGNRVNRKSILKTDDVLVVRTGYPGTSCVVTPEYDGANCIDIIFARPDSNRIESRFLSAFINSESGKLQVLKAEGGLAQKHFNVGSMKLMKIPLPTIAEQREIVCHIEDFTQAENSLKKLLEQYKCMKSALMSDLLTGRKRVTDTLPLAAE